MARDAIHTVIRFLFQVLSRLDVQGWDCVPTSGSALIASNHRARLDAALIFALLDRRDSTSLVADKYKKSLLLRPLVEGVHGIWINREHADLHALREALQLLNAGGLLGIAPEGTRSPTGGLIEAKTGVAYLADKARCPVIPVAMWGTDGQNAWKLLRLHRPVISVRVGQPIYLPPVTRGERDAILRRNTDEVMCHIAAMLPPEYRGVYASHPRLQEILAAGRLNP